MECGALSHAVAPTTPSPSTTWNPMTSIYRRPTAVDGPFLHEGAQGTGRTCSHASSSLLMNTHPAYCESTGAPAICQLHLSPAKDCASERPKFANRDFLSLARGARNSRQWARCLDTYPAGLLRLGRGRAARRLHELGEEAKKCEHCV